MKDKYSTKKQSGYSTKKQDGGKDNKSKKNKDNKKGKTADNKKGKTADNKKGKSRSQNEIMNSKSQAIFDEIASFGTNTYKFKEQKYPQNPIYKTVGEYNNSFTDVINFSKKYNDSQKKSFDYVLYHRNNADGVMSAYIYWNYLTRGGAKEGFENVVFRGVDPDHQLGSNRVSPRAQQFLNEIDGKNVLVLDVSYNRPTLDEINRRAKFMVYIDDHTTTGNKGTGISGLSNIFIGTKHSASAYTSKFFYPEEPVPFVVQYIDNNDAKLQLPYLPYGNEFIMAFSVRITNNVMFNQITKDQVYGGMFTEIHKLINCHTANFLIFIGRFMNEYRENVKFEIAENARPGKFQGYDVMVLNFDAPSLTKVVGRQIMTDHPEKQFAVIWSYHYLRKAYRVTLIDDHRSNPPKIDLGKLANRMGGMPEGGGGGGHGHIGNFYWKGDIFKLVEGN